MSCSKPLPPFVCDTLYYLNRDQLERFSIVGRTLKNFIERYFHSKPYGVFDALKIRCGSYALSHHGVQWHPNRDDYTMQQFRAGQKYHHPRNDYLFAEMHPYLGLSIRIKQTIIDVARESIYNSEHIAEMETLAFLWRDSEISISHDLSRINAEHIQPILNSLIILKCQKLRMYNAHFSFKDYQVLYTVKVIELLHNNKKEIDICQKYWQQFLEQPGVKPIVVLRVFFRENFDILLNRLSEDFSSAVVPNAFKVVFVQFLFQQSLTEFRETNKTSGKKLELKKGLPVEYQNKYLEGFVNYTLDRSTI